MTELTLEKGKGKIVNSGGAAVAGSFEAGTEDGFSPRELLEAALGFCTVISLVKLFKRDNMAYEEKGLRVTVEAEKQEGVTNRFTNFVVKVALPAGLPAEYRAKALTIAERACTIGNTLKSEARVQLLEETEK